MKKRLSWAILALVLIFTSIGPISAAETNPEAEGEWILLSDEQEVSVLPTDSTIVTQTDIDENALEPYAYPSVHGSISYISIYPTALATINGEFGIYRYSGYKVTYTSLSQFEQVRLGTEGTKRLMDRLEAALQADNIDYILYGWHLEVGYIFEAPTPVSFAWYASETNMESSEIITTDLRGYGSSVTFSIPFNFPFPPNVDVYKDKYEIKLGGRYKFKNANNVEMEMDVFGSCVLNAS